MSMADIATTPAVVCRPAATVEQVARMMREHDIGCVVVVDLDERPVGIITDRDLVMRCLAAGRPPSTAIEEVMTHEPVSIGLDHDTIDAARQMAERECRRLPVVGTHGQVLGVVAFDDLILRAGHTLDELARVVTVEGTGKSPAGHHK